MKVLDRYIITTFLVNFVVLSVVFAGLYMVVDLIVDVDEFVAAGEAWSSQYGGFIPAFAMVLLDWYGPLLLLMYTSSSGLIAAAGMGFTLAGMQRNRELIAMLAGGVSMYRVAAPVLVVGFVLNAACWPLQEYVLPQLAYKVSREKSDLKHEQARTQPVHYAADEQGNLVSAAGFDAQAGHLQSVTILQRDDQGLATGRITADQATWVGDEAGPGGSDSGWWFGGKGGLEVKPRGEFEVRQAKPVHFFQTGLSPTVLAARRATMLPRFLSVSELKQMRANPAVAAPQQAQITQVIWSRFTLMVVNVLILVMGLPFFLLRTPRNMLFQSVKAASLCLGAWGGGLLLLTVSVSAIPPVAGAWLPVVLYMPVAAILVTMIET